MRATRPFPRHTLLLSAVLAALLAPPAAALGQPGEPMDHGSVGKCAVCMANGSCALASENGANSCTVTVGEGCKYELSICVVAMERTIEDLRLSPEEMLILEGGGRELALAPVGGSRYAAWNCVGQVIRVVEKRGDGSVVDLPVQRFGRRYAYARVVAAVARTRGE
jgi:hypothetical protein